MGKDSSIEWTTHTQNFWVGCRKVSSGCLNCYMFREQERYGNDPTLIRRTSDKTFYAPLAWKEPAYVFTCSWSDFFLEDADGWRDDAWNIIKQTPHLTYQILTKRPHNIEGRLPKDWGNGYPNVWLGVSVEDPKNLWRIEELYKYPAALYFVSHEPLLKPHFLERYAPLGWAIIGGESGSDARPMNLDGVLEMIEEFHAYGIPVFVKQLGTAWAKEHPWAKDWKGADISEWPEALIIREMPSRP